MKVTSSPWLNSREEETDDEDMELSSEKCPQYQLTAFSFGTAFGLITILLLFASRCRRNVISVIVSVGGPHWNIHSQEGHAASAMNAMRFKISVSAVAASCRAYCGYADSPLLLLIRPPTRIDFPRIFPTHMLVQLFYPYFPTPATKTIETAEQSG